MAIWVLKPAERDGGEMASGVTTFESNDDGTTLGTYFSSSGALATAVPRAGHTTDQISNANWYDNGYTGSSVGFTIMLFKVTAIGSNSAPTISDLNNDQLITDVLHSSASGSANGVNHYNGATTAYNMDWNNQSLTSNGTTYSLSGLTQVTGNAAPDVRQRTQNNDEGNVYYNGILVGSQSSQEGDQTSSNESYVDWSQWSSLASYTASGGTKEVLKNNITGNNDAYLSAMLDCFNSSHIRQIHTTLKNNNTIS